jgi:mRNA interferase HigB
MLPNRERTYGIPCRELIPLRVISRGTLRDFWIKPENADSEGPLKAWFYEASRGTWSDPADVKAKYSSASILKGGRVVFNIGGNKYRLVVRINYGAGIVYIRFVGTHREYDQINAEEV